MKIPQNKLIRVKLSELKQRKSKVKTHDEKNIVAACRAIKHFDIIQPLMVESDYTIISGNLRYEAAKRLGIEEIDVVVIDNLSEDEIRAYIIAENKIAEMAGWDKEVLKLELQYLTDIGYELINTGFEMAEIDLIINDAVIEDPEEEELPDLSDVEHRVKRGDIWEAGKHRIINADALNRAAYLSLLQGEIANISFVDFPYNVKIAGNVTTKKHHKEFYQASGEMSKDEFTEFLKSAMTLIKEFSMDGSIHYFCMDWRHIQEIVTAGISVFDELKNVCVWAKDTAGLGSLYRSQHELVFVYKNGTAPHVNNIQLGTYGRYRTNVWNYKGMHVSNPEAAELLKLHSTPKPTAMCMDAMLDCSKPNDIVLDSFAGSGSTLIAAEKVQRRARVIEIEPHYCDVILYRWEKLTGKKAKLIGNIGDNK